MKTKLYFSIILISLFSFGFQKSTAQINDLHWAKSIGGSYGDGCYSIAADALNNVYVMGIFRGTVDFDPGPGIYNLTDTNQSSYVCKLDGWGNLIWVRTISGINFGPMGGRSNISIDESGNIYTIGNFTGTVDIDPGSGIFNLVSAGGEDIFISKLDSGGNFIWAKQIGGSGRDVNCRIAIEKRGNNNICIAGSFRDTADFDPGAGIFNLVSAGLEDIFISKLDSGGNFIWAKRIGGVDQDVAQSIAIDTAGNGDVYTAGTYTWLVDFNPDPLVAYNLHSNGNNIYAFISKLDSSGNFVWAKAIGGSGFSSATSIVIDPAGSRNVYITGHFQGSTDFDPGVGIFNLVSAGISDIFISKLSSSGDFMWARKIGAANNDDAWSIAIDPSGSGDIYTTGGFMDTVDFNQGGGSYILNSKGMLDAFILKLDSSANFEWVKQAGGTGSERGHSIVLSDSGYLFVAGAFGSPSLSFNLNSVLTNAGTGSSHDGFIGKYGCIEGSIQLTVSSCNSYISPSGHYTWINSGLYQDILPGIASCDSLVIIELTINAVDTLVTQIGNTLTSNDTVSFYQWLDCNNGYAPISGEINRNFTAIANGSYAVAVNLNGCIDTSACYTIVGVGMNEVSGLGYLAVYPNPVEATGYCDFQLIEKAEVRITVRDMLGKEVAAVQNQNLTTGIYHQRLDLSTLTSGIYFLHISINDGEVVRKVIKH